MQKVTDRQLKKSNVCYKKMLLKGKILETTMDLLSKALQTKKAAYWIQDLSLNQSTISTAKKRGRLSPVLAGNLAMKLGEDPEYWIAVAALEAEPQSALLERLKDCQNNWRNRRDSNSR